MANEPQDHTELRATGQEQARRDDNDRVEAEPTATSGHSDANSQAERNSEDESPA